MASVSVSPGDCQTFKAAADLSASQFKLVEVTAAHTVNICGATTDVAIGVLTNCPAAEGEEAVVQVRGIAKVQADAAVAAGAWVGTSADGQAVTKTTDKDWVVGVALEAAGAAGDIISVLLCPCFLAV